MHRWHGTFLLMLVFLSACVPSIKANPGEVIYQYVPGEADTLFAGTGAVDFPFAVQVGTTLISYFYAYGSGVPGYKGFAVQSALELSPTIHELSLVAKQDSGANQIQTLWRIVDRGQNLVGLYAHTTATDPTINVARIEDDAFKFLDGLYKRVSSNR